MERYKRSLMLFQNEELRKLFGRKRDDVTLEWRKRIMSSLMFSTAHQILFDCGNQDEYYGRGV